MNSLPAESQERYNAEWIRSNRYGIVLRSFANVNQAVTDRLDLIAVYRSHLAQYFNCAVFEAVDILQQIIDDPRLPASGVSDVTASPSSI